MVNSVCQTGSQSGRKLGQVEVAALLSSVAGQTLWLREQGQVNRTEIFICGSHFHIT